ncbi:MAG: cadmium-translocating P-type ATPase [Hespellia sp.]|nr:cadmium-translocating P-type ATPase [Hespellia sp.]
MSKDVKYKAFEAGAGIILFACTFFALNYLTESELLIWYLAAYIPASIDIYIKVVSNIRHLKIFNEHFLIVLATIGAFLVGEFAEAVAVMLFFQIGELLELLSLERSKRAITEFMDIRPEYANWKLGDKEFVVEPSHLKIDHIIIIKPGERIPVDAIVISGNSTIDTKALTGEAMPQEVVEGDVLYSGSINLTGVLEARVFREYVDSTATRILDLVEEANAKKGENERFVDKFTVIYTPLVMLLAFAVMIIPSVTFAQDQVHTWVYRGLIVLVTAIPCGLMLSVPLAFFGGIGSAARQGILIKGCNYLEDLAKVDTFVFDKTGTLTKGVFAVSEIHPRKITNEKMLEVVAYAEAYSNHPIAFSLRKAYGEQIDRKKVELVREYSGFGVQAMIEGKEVLVGNAKFLSEHQIYHQKPDHSGTAVHLAIDHVYEGYILITDILREDTIETMAELKRDQKVLVMLTGDNEKAAQSMGKRLNIDYVYANLLPGDKVAKLEEFIESEMGEDKLAFVGDGLNDAPVLARADIGIAMGGLGSDAAIEAADIVLMEDEPYRIITALNIAKETIHIVKQNMAFAIGIKLILLGLAAVGFVTMRNAIVADMGVLIINLLNSYWVLKYLE